MRKLRYCGAVSVIVVGAIAGAHLTKAAQPARQPLQSLLLSKVEIEQVLKHGPWPPPLKPDPSNNASGNAAAVAFGRLLFFETRLSADGKMSCATCHQPDRAWSDGQSLGQPNVVKQDRNTQSLIDVRFNRWFGWGGQGDSLWSQSIRPIIAPEEMNASTGHVIGLLADDQHLSLHYVNVFGVPAKRHEPEQALANVGKALAAFQETLVSPRTSFDEFRDALAVKNWKAAAEYPLVAQRGAKIFAGRGRCNVCHVGPRFTSGEFHDAGVPYFIAPGRVDPGRFNGITAVKRNPWNLSSRHNDDQEKTGAWATKQVTRLHRNFGEFRIPTLRNLTATAPYMHNGSLPTLERVVRHYSEINIERLHADGERILRPLNLSNQELADMVAFLRTLSTWTPRTPPRE